MFYLILFNEVITIYFIINNWLLFISWADNDDMKEQVRTEQFCRSNTRITIQQSRPTEDTYIQIKMTVTFRLDRKYIYVTFWDTTNMLILWFY